MISFHVFVLFHYGYILIQMMGFSFFNNCTHPTLEQRQELSMELGLTQNQIKFWFQNRRTQRKTENKRASAEILKVENKRLKRENLAINESLINSFCPTCDRSVVRDQHHQSDIQKLRTENLKLKQKLERLSKPLENTLGKGHICSDQIQTMLLFMKMGSFGTFLDFNPGCYDNPSPTYQMYAQRDEQMLMTNPPVYSVEGGVMPQGRANLMYTTQRMVNAFWSALSKCEKVDFSGGIQVSVRLSDVSGGMVVSASSSSWLSVSRAAIFDYLNDEKSRVQWDILTDSSSIRANVDIAYGSYPGNRVLIFEPLSFSDNDGFIIQESCNVPSGSLIVYAPVPIPWLKSVMSGEGSILPTLPAGFIIIDGGKLDHRADVASSSSSSGRLGGSILTMFYQIFADSIRKPEDLVKAVADVNHIISCTMLSIKSALCANISVL